MKIISIDSTTETEEEIAAFNALWNDENQAIRQKTSGSTGTPKVIEIPKWKMKNSAKMTGEFFDLNNCKTALICLSPNYIGGKMMLVRSILYNLTLIVTNVTRNPLKNVTSEVDFAAMVPLQVKTILEESPEKLNLIKYLIIGGAPVSDDLIQKISQYNCKAYSTFGMTETVSHIALRELKNIDEPYKVVGNTSLSLENDCLVITNKELEIHQLKTNDIVELVDDRTFFWKGRADFVINSGGVKVHPEEVEQKIKNVLYSENFIISWLPDDKLGSKVVFIGENDLNTADIQEKIEKTVNKYEKPKAYYYISELIKTPSGKIDRIKTRAAIL